MARIVKKGKSYTIYAKDPVFSTELQRRIGEDVGKKWVEIIRDRTMRGEFGPDSTFPRALRYNHEYAKRKGVSLRPVTLHREGDMLRKMTYSVYTGPSQLTVGIDFQTAEEREKARFHQEVGAGPSHIKREFTYATEDEIETMLAHAFRRPPRMV